jgi:hypothetical protein
MRRPHRKPRVVSELPLSGLMFCNPLGWRRIKFGQKLSQGSLVEPRLWVELEQVLAMALCPGSTMVGNEASELAVSRPSSILRASFVPSAESVPRSIDANLSSKTTYA